MSEQIPAGFAHRIRGMAALWQYDRSDEELLAAFANDSDQSAFTTLIGRHGAAVWAVCRGILAERADAEDAFQTTFITLARMCRRVHVESGSVSGWLKRVAQNAALDIQKALRRRDAAHRRLCERARPQSSETSSVSDDEFRTAMHEELDRLPLGLRAPLALYYLEGKTQFEIGRILGMPNQTVSYRIRKGLNTLRKRLAKRGLVVTATALVALLGVMPVALAVSPALIVSTTAAALKAATDSVLPAAATPAGLALTPLMKVVMIGFIVGVAAIVGFWACPSALNNEVSGSVLMGEQPLARAEVVLVPDDGANQQCRQVRTQTDGEGRFRFAVGAGNDQVAPGRYRVLVLDRASGKKDWVVPSDYRAMLETPLRLEVGNSPVVFDIPITPVMRREPMVQPHSPQQEIRRRLCFVLRTEFGQFE